MVCGHFGIDWKGEYLARRSFRLREVADSMPEGCEARLDVQRDRIVNHAADLIAAEMLHHGIAVSVRDANAVLVVNVPLVVSF